MYCGRMVITHSRNDSTSISVTERLYTFLESMNLCAYRYTPEDTIHVCTTNTDVVHVQAVSYNL